MELLESEQKNWNEHWGKSKWAITPEKRARGEVRRQKIISLSAQGLNCKQIRETIGGRGDDICTIRMIARRDGLW